jgi:glycosyltransferase involved in cell wall biosynthesis
VAAPLLSVVITTYSPRRWETLVECVRAVQQQSLSPHEIVVVVDNNPGLLARAAERFPDVRVVASSGRAGVSSARNAGVQCTTGDVVAFVDDDAVPDRHWLAALARAYGDTGVVGTGGAVRAAFESRRAWWFPEEFDWVMGCSYRGLRAASPDIRNPIGANMSFRRSALDAAGPFAEELGPGSARGFYAEETELSIRVRQRTGGRIVHVPDARVDHMIPDERMRWRYFARRCWSEGGSKAEIVARLGSAPALASERAYATRTLPAGVVRELSRAVHGDLTGLGRGAAIVAGLSITLAAYVRGRLDRNLAPARS